LKRGAGFLSRAAQIFSRLKRHSVVQIVQFDAHSRHSLYEILMEIRRLFIIRSPNSRECFRHGKMQILIYGGSDRGGGPEGIASGAAKGNPGAD
jgi:hypothetical protein